MKVKTMLVCIILFTISGCATSRTPLMNAASKGDIDTAQKLIKNGADINDGDRSGLTPLMMAINSDKPEAAKAFIQMGADIERKDGSGYTPLFLAVCNSNASIVRLLIDNGADVNTKNSEGMTPLHYAALHLEPEKSDNIIKILLDNGADASIKDNYGQTPLKYASTYRMIENVILIRTKYEGNDDEIPLSFDDALRVPSRINPDRGAFLVPPGKEKAYANAILDCNDLIIPYKRTLLITTGPIGYGAGLAFDAATTQGKFQKCMEKMGFKCIKNCSK